MRSFISNLKKDKQVYVFVALGIVLILFPDRIAEYAPHIVGVALILYSVVNIFMELRFPESTISLGDAVVRGVLGVILLLETSQAIAILSIVWAVLSLNDVAEEINDFYRTRKFRLVGAVSIVLTIIFSAMLMLDPFGHFVFHIRILGLEMIAETFIRRRED
ncbi:MAG: hypothetical protein IJ591_01930 [Lachnospiraceae bacterium]|nr:hypothetical protein [Lachnospiraceae bacterium]